MSQLGFWNFAQSDPSKLGLVCPDGAEVSRGELLASCNQLVHGLRALGLEQGDCVATVIPNGRAMIELYLAACQAGWYLSPINHHLTAPEIAYIASDSGASSQNGIAVAAITIAPNVIANGYPCDSAANDMPIGPTK